MTKKGLCFVDRVNSYQLTPELLGGAMLAIAEMAKEDRQSFEARTISIVRFVHDQDDLSDDERMDAGLAIQFRLEALARLELPNVPEWTSPGNEPGMDWLHSDVIRCAAEEPLMRDGEAMRFDTVTFQHRLLTITDALGQA